MSRSPHISGLPRRYVSMMSAWRTEPVNDLLKAPRQLTGLGHFALASMRELHQHGKAAPAWESCAMPATDEDHRLHHNAEIS